MKATDFLNDWQSGTHTSNPSIQDIIDWTERCYIKEKMDLSAPQQVEIGMMETIFTGLVSSTI